MEIVAAPEKALDKYERSFYSEDMNAITRLSKGEETRAVILKAALRHASREGFEALTIGSLAEETGLSKSGLFAHFGSKEELQIATIDEGIRRFNETCMLPALSLPRGLKRLTAMWDLWLTWTLKNDLVGCPMMTAMSEFDDKPGPVRDAVVEHMNRLHEGLIKSVQMAVDSGELAADTDPEQMAFELFGIISSCFRSRNLFHDPMATQRARKAFDRLISSCSTSSATTARASASASASQSAATGADTRTNTR